jgi:hypothetical protein
MKNTFSNEQIQVVMEKSGITRKSALKKLGKMTPKELAALTAGFVQKNAGVTVPVVDVKSRAANDDTNQPPAGLVNEVIKNSKPEVVAGLQAASTPAKKEEPKPQTAAGAARGEGIRLFKLSNVATLAKDEGTTTKALFQHVYGPKGHSMTWEQRAKAVGLATAEEAAKQFARMRGEKAGSCIVAKAEPTTEKK